MAFQFREWTIYKGFLGRILIIITIVIVTMMIVIIVFMMVIGIAQKALYFILISNTINITNE